MNNESVFFNPGDAIASSHDFKEARRSAQIFKAEKPTARKIVIAQNDKNGEFAVYYADEVKSTPLDVGAPHHIKEKF
ncbi:hypothetical protein [uncultured Lactobacillus sp.]|uniref:hypothetical protein n=1 Tax=uncultured Lactobacillus sp. TaxID=153152 RepID=UPI00262B0BD4|nr:hypothetical protein [uncultured Lactobacillus sp.]